MDFEQMEKDLLNLCEDNEQMRKAIKGYFKDIIAF